MLRQHAVHGAGGGVALVGEVADAELVDRDQGRLGAGEEDDPQKTDGQERQLQAQRHCEAAAAGSGLQQNDPVG